jgi:hypothetical protein
MAQTKTEETGVSLSFRGQEFFLSMKPQDCLAIMMQRARAECGIDEDFDLCLIESSTGNPIEDLTKTFAESGLGKITILVEYTPESKAKAEKDEIERSMFICQQEILKFEADLQSNLDELSKAEPSSKLAAFIASCISTTQTDISKLQNELRELTVAFYRLSPSVKAQREKVPSDLFSSQDENNWRAAGTFIFHACDQARHFVEESFKKLHQEILRRTGNSNSAVSSSHSHCSEMQFSEDYDDYEKDNLQKFAFSVIDWHVSLARQMQFEHIRVCDVKANNYESFLQHAQQVRIAWQNSDRNLWMDPILGPFEMAKLFCKSFGSVSNPPRGFSDLEPSPLFRMLMRCSFFTLNDRQLFRARTLKGCIWSYKLWKAAYSSSRLNSDDFSLIRSRLSQFVQEVNIAKSNPANLDNLQSSFEQKFDPSESVHSLSSISSSVQGGDCCDSVTDEVPGNLDPVIWEYTRKMSQLQSNKFIQAQASLHRHLRLTDAEFAVCKLHDSFIVAQVEHAVTAPLHVSAASVTLIPSASAACCLTSFAKCLRSSCSGRCPTVLLPCLKPRTDVIRLVQMEIASQSGLWSSKSGSLAPCL